jgi:probable phosphoglycerate mutase
LREIDFGDLEGKTWDQCDAETQAALVGFVGFAAPGGESVESLKERVLGFLAGLGPGNQLIFTHGGVIRLIQTLTGSGHSAKPGELVVLDWPARSENRQRRGA